MMQLTWYKVEPYKDVVDSVPDKDGVYALSTLQGDGNYKVCYVGQGNIRDRLTLHLSKYEPNEELKNHIAKGHYMKASYAEVSSQENRDGIELFLYNKFSPEFNKNTPPGKNPIGTNLFAMTR